MGVFHRVTAPDRGANDSVRRDTLAGWLALLPPAGSLTGASAERPTPNVIRETGRERERVRDREEPQPPICPSLSQSVSE